MDWHRAKMSIAPGRQPGGKGGISGHADSFATYCRIANSQT
jgi:hypothetical protein